MNRYRITTANRKFKTQKGADAFITRTMKRNELAMGSGLIRGQEFSTGWDADTRRFTVKVRTEWLVNP